MTANLTKPRPDIVYLRRRLKVGEKLPTGPVETQTTNSLSLTPPTGPVEVKLPTVPAATENTVLTAQKPAVRLNRRQSAVGSLALANVSYVAWELLDGSTGFLYSTAMPSNAADVVNYKTGETRPALPEIVPASFKNRPVVEFHRGMLVIGLRSLKSIKRIIAVPLEGKNIEAATLNGTSVTLPYLANEVMYMSVVESCLEIRAEKFRGNIHETFRIGTYTPSTTSVQGNNSLRSFFSENR